MKFTEKISIVGGDFRFVKLAEILLEEGINVYTYGLEKSDELKKTEGIVQCNTINEIIEISDVIIGPIPFSKNGIELNAPYCNNNIKIIDLIKGLENKTFIAGNIPNEINIHKSNVIDILKREELVILNAISTAEGAIQISMQETLTTLSECKVLIMGFGRIGKILSCKLKGMGIDIYCEARKPVDFAWMRAYGYKIVKLEELDNKINDFDVIINTIPHLVLNSERIRKMKHECVIIDLASLPGGVDKEEAERHKVKVISALGLPGKVAPVTSAEYIKETVKNIIMENKKGGF